MRGMLPGLGTAVTLSAFSREQDVEGDGALSRRLPLSRNPDASFFPMDNIYVISLRYYIPSS